MENNFEPSFIHLVVTRYEGQLDTNAKFEGKGEAHFDRGHVYVGSFKDGMMDGDGVFTWSEGVSFSGTFRKNKICGCGKYKWSDGTEYDGQVMNGLRHGNGKMSGSDGGNPWFQGSWRTGQRHGVGTQFYNAERTCFYDGFWVDDKREGRGTMIYASGNVYSGTWVADMKSGEGEMFWHDRGEFYAGEWLDDRQQGRGKHVWTELLTKSPEDSTQRRMRNRYHGSWKGGMRHGAGAFFYANGSEYFGEWHRGEKEGNGMFVYEDGSLFAGKFSGDRLLNPQPCQIYGENKLVSLHLRDSVKAEPLAGSSESRMLDKAISRHNSELREIFAAYVSSDDSDHGLDCTFAMSSLAFLAFCDDISSSTNPLSSSCIHLLLQAMHRQHSVIYTTAALRHNCFGTSLKQAQRFKPLFPQSEKGRLLYREFVEAVVRVAIAVASCQTPGLSASRALDAFIASFSVIDIAQPKKEVIFSERLSTHPSTIPLSILIPYVYKSIDDGKNKHAHLNSVVEYIICSFLGVCHKRTDIKRYDLEAVIVMSNGVIGFKDFVNIVAMSQCYRRRGKLFEFIPKILHTVSTEKVEELAAYSNRRILSSTSRRWHKRFRLRNGINLIRPSLQRAH